MVDQVVGKFGACGTTLERGVTVLVATDEEEARRIRGRATRAGICRASMARRTLRTSYPTTLTPRCGERLPEGPWELSVHVRGGRPS